jgi:hypothetical protein
VFFQSIDNICFGSGHDLQRWNILSNKNSTYWNMKNAFKHNFFIAPLLNVSNSVSFCFRQASSRRGLLSPCVYVI